jgi:acetyltransferase-like isoleucine patch superfamily enzyme
VHDSLEIPFEDQGIQSKGVRIGNNVWIGAGSVIADGAVVGDKTIDVANSLETRRYPPNVIIQGAPAKVILRRGRAAATEPS